jgi:hypothetical protein
VPYDEASTLPGRNARRRRNRIVEPAALILLKQPDLSD